MKWQHGRAANTASVDGFHCRRQVAGPHLQWRWSCTPVLLPPLLQVRQLRCCRCSIPTAASVRHGRRGRDCPAAGRHRRRQHRAHKPRNRGGQRRRLGRGRMAGCRRWAWRGGGPGAGAVARHAVVRVLAKECGHGEERRLLAARGSRSSSCRRRCLRRQGRATAGGAQGRGPPGVVARAGCAPAAVLLYCWRAAEGWQAVRQAACHGGGELKLQRRQRQRGWRGA